MSGNEPWRNPRPAPQLPEMKPQLHRVLLPAWLRAWWPALVWACVIFTLSTDAFSAEHTASILSPILHWLAPHLTHAQFNRIHHLIRKSAHFTEYFIFFLLLYRAFRGEGRGWRWGWGFSAWFIAAAYSCLDEVHQAFIASRTATPYDSLLDSIGAFVALVVVFLWFRVRNSPLSSDAEKAGNTGAARA